VADSVETIVAFVTAPSREVAERIVRDLVERRLVACGNVVGGVRSIYRWQGAVEEADEVLAILKARASDLGTIAERVRALHPYEVPEVVALRIAGGWAPYLAWIAESTERSGQA
jgi:periplasmic divalent cation tolerance protein